MKTTPYEDVNKVLHSLTERLVSTFGENLIGLYLTGSLSYGDFNPESSDIDLLAVLKKPASKQEAELLKKLHLEIGTSNKNWAKRIECSYVPVDMLQNVLPPKLPRPYIGEGVFYPEAPYGNEWLINNYLLFKHGVALLGPDFRKLVKPINITDVQKACIRDLYEEWLPKIGDSTYLKNSHYQSYAVLNMCRILYTVVCGKTASKKISAAWVKNEFAPKWSSLIQAAENWRYGTEMNFQKETVEFIKFVISRVKKLHPKTR